MVPLPPLDDLLESNRAPTDEEHETIYHFFSDYDNRLRALTEKICKLEMYLQDLNNEKIALLKAVAPFKRILSPLRRMPEDVLREIFIACIDRNTNPSMSNTEAPMVLTQITSGMRRISLKTPELWAAIHIPIIGSSPLDSYDIAKSIMKRRTMGVKEWLLRRSGNLPLRISVREIQRQGRPASYINKAIIAAIFSCRSRWRDITFAMSPDVIRSRLFPLTPADVPLLHSLYLNFGVGSWGQFSLLQSSSLKRFGGVFDKFSGMPMLQVRWENITDLNFPSLVLNPSHLANLAHILRNCSRLVSLRITVARTTSLNMDDIDLPYLKILAVEELPGEPTSSSIVDAIQAPHLSTVIFNRKSHVNSWTSMFDLLGRATGVKELLIGHCTSPAALRDCLENCPSLNMLTLDAKDGGPGSKDAGADDEMLAQFVLADSEECLCPRLEYFRCRAVLAVSAAGLRDFIMCKTGEVAHLARWRTLSLVLYCTPDDRPVVDGILAQGAAEGIKFDIAFCAKPPPLPSVFSEQGRLIKADDSWPSTELWPILGEPSYLNWLLFQGI